LPNIFQTTSPNQPQPTQNYNFNQPTQHIQPVQSHISLNNLQQTPNANDFSTMQMLFQTGSQNQTNTNSLYQPSNITLSQPIPQKQSNLDFNFN
jgi:hypothetical protein